MERVIGPDSNILIDFMLSRLTSLIKGLQVYPKNMKQNMELTKGLIFSEKVLLKLVDKGLTREKAYEMVQRNAMKCWEQKRQFKGILMEDKELSNYLSKKEIDAGFELKNEFKNIDLIFNRVFS